MANLKQQNNDYYDLPSNLWDVYRGGGNNLFHHPSGQDLTADEQQQLTEAWQTSEVQSGQASWDAEPCQWCGNSVCTCHANPESTFFLPPEEN